MSLTDRESICVLHVDDEPDLTDLTATFLERERRSFEVLTETSARDGLDRLEERAVDCVVSDFDMPAMDGLEFLDAVRERYPDLPFILFTGKGSEEIASEAISAGVTDYLQKDTGSDQYTLLANRIERAVEANRAEDALAESERAFSTLVSNLPGTVYRCRMDPAWPMEFVSDGSVALSGYEPETLESGAVQWGTDVVHPDDRESLWERVKTAIETDEQFEVTYRIRTNDGETKWVWEQGRGVYEDDDLVAIEGFITDVTEHREARVNRRKYETIVESMEDAAFVLDADGTFEFVNDAFLSVTDADRGSVIGAGSEYFADEIAGADRDRFQRLVDRLRRDETQRVTTVFEMDLGGSERTIDLRMNRIEDDGRFRGIVGIARDVTEHSERERELERYRTLVENVGDPIYVLDADGYIEVANRAMADRLGYEQSELIGMHATDVMPTTDVERGTELLFDVAADDERTAATFEMHAITNDGEQFPCEDNVTVLTDDEGNYRGSAGVVREITDRKRREEELERYRTLVETVGDAMYVLDENATIEMANGAMADHLNCSREDVEGEHVSRFMTDEDVETGTRLISELVADDERKWATFELETIAFDGDRSVAEDKIAILTDEDGEFTGSVGIIRDISDRKARERELERYETIVQAVGDPVYSLDATGQFTFINDAIEPLTGYDPDELVGEHVSTVMRESDVETGTELIETLLASDDRTNATFEMDLLTREGDPIPSENHMALLPVGEDGQVRGTAGVVRDITERKQREQRLEQFASVVSHDLRNPLNVISGRVQLLRETGDFDNLDVIEESAEQMEQLIDDLLALAHKGQTVGQTGPVELDDVVRSAWDLVDTEDATLSVESELGTVTADGDRLLELFQNLFSNAVEHSSGQSDAGGVAGGGSVTVRVGPIEAEEGSAPDGVYVADDGPGIPPDQRERVFEHGYSNSESGTGFGLSIVRNVAQAHGWSVSITESWAGGARFELTGFDYPGTPRSRK